MSKIAAARSPSVKALPPRGTVMGMKERKVMKVTMAMGVAMICSHLFLGI
jgi:hypothetical protein